MKNIVNAADAATDARMAADKQQALAKLVEIASKVAETINQLGMEGTALSSAKHQWAIVINQHDPDRRFHAAHALAACLRKGNAAANKIAGEIENVLQLRQPGLDEAPAKQHTAPASVAIRAPHGPSGIGTKVPSAPALATGQINGEHASAAKPAVQGSSPNGITSEARPVPINEIRTAEPFCTLFPVNAKTLDAIVADIQAKGFDAASPVVVWAVRNIVVDGHTRVEAARRAGLEEIPVVFRNFAAEDDALQYAINVQRNRRNLSDAEIFRLVQVLDSRRNRGGDRRSEKAKSNAQPCAIEKFTRSSAETAQKIGVSPRKVEQARQIRDNADSQTLEAVSSGKMSIPKAAASLGKKGRTAGNPDARQVAKRAVKQLHAIEADLQGHGNVFVLALAKLGEVIAEIGKAADAAAQ